MTGLEKYKQTLFSCLSCSPEEKAYFFSHICRSAEADEQEDLSYEELVSVFGTPETVAAAYIDQSTTEDSLTEVQKIIHRLKRIKTIVGFVCIFFASLIIYVCLWSLAHPHGTTTIGEPVLDSIETIIETDEGGIVP